MYLINLLKNAFFAIALTSSSFLSSAEDLPTSINQFGYELYYFINQPGENVVISPFSICSSLYMVYSGSRKKTAHDFAETLFLSSTPKEIPKMYKSLTQPLFESSNSSEEGYQLMLANGAWIGNDFTVLQNYKNLIQEDFKGDIFSINFKKTSIAMETVNRWVSKQTNDKIYPLLTERDIDPSTQLMLTNAVYVKGSWKYPFKTKNSYKGQFHPLMNPSSPVLIDMMQQEYTFPYYENESFQQLMLPLEKNEKQVDIAMLILLPKQGITQSPFLHFYQNKHSAFFDELLDKMDEKSVNVHLPKWTMKTHINLADFLKTMGLQIPFSNKADFSGINGKTNLRLSKVIHETLFSINEDGLLATAATSSSLGLTSLPPNKETISFIADRPFIYFLLDLKSKTILFLGELDNP